MKCPTCNVNLVMSDRNGVEIDYCPECRGVWLDRGELDKIIDRATANSPATAAATPRYDSHQEKQYGHSHDEHGYKKKRKDSFLGDLFDF